MFKRALVLFLLFTSPVMAQTSQPTKTEVEPADPGIQAFQEKRFITLDAGLNMTTHYFARGIGVENQSVIAQPWIELQMHLYQSDGFLSDVYLFGKSWNSFHSGPTGTGSSLSGSPSAWYETQFTFGLGVKVFKVLTVSGGYNVQISPNDRFSTVEEMYVRGDLADKHLWNLKGEVGSVKWEFDGVRVYGLFAWETDGQRDKSYQGQALNRGVYAEVGAKPGVTLHPHDQFSIKLSVPFSVGFNVFEYYEVVGEGDDPFGFFTLGVEGEIPLKFIPSKYGAWSLYGNFTWWNLGQNVSRFNNNENDELVGSGGVRFAF